MYSYKTTIRFSEVDRDFRLTLPALMIEFQDCSLAHADSVGQGAPVLRKEDHIWLLSSWQIIIDRLPSLYEDVTVSTWAYGFRGFFGFRNFTMTGADGHIDAWANSNWIYIDTKTGHPSRIPREASDAFGIDPAFPMEVAGRKITVPGDPTAMDPFPVRKADIDANGHVNNERYVELAQEYLPDGFVTRQLRAEYRRAALYGDILYPEISDRDGTFTVALDDAQKKPYAIVEFSREPLPADGRTGARDERGD